MSAAGVPTGRTVSTLHGEIVFPPAVVLIVLGAAKFALVAMFYMHLKYDHRLFRVLFTGPLLIASLTLLALLFLFGHLFIKIM